MNTKQKTILLVEDNPDDAELTLASFAQAKLTNNVDVVRDGASALNYLLGEGEFAHRANADLPIVVLLDLGLPKIGGFEVLRVIRSTPKLKRLPVVILTSSDEETDRLQSYDLGANSFVRKPIDFCNFTEAISQLGIYWSMINQPCS